MSLTIPISDPQQEDLVQEDLDSQTNCFHKASVVRILEVADSALSIK